MLRFYTTGGTRGNDEEFYAAMTRRPNPALSRTAKRHSRSPSPAESRAPRAPLRVVGARIYLVTIGGRHPVLVEVLTDQGVSGVGEAAIAYGIGATAAAGMIKDLVDAFVGADPFRIEAVWVEMYGHSFWAKGGGPDQEKRKQVYQKLQDVLVIDLPHLPIYHYVGITGLKPSLQGYVPNSNVVESSWNSNEWWVKR